MSQKHAFRDLIWPAVFTVMGIGIFISLGAWQLHRKNWKLDLINRIETRSKAEPLSLEVAEAETRGASISVLHRGSKNGLVALVEYRRIKARGRFDHAHERHLFSLLDGAPGWRVVTPLETGQGTGQGTERGRIVLVDRGFVPAALKEPASRPQGQIEGEVEVTGVVRAPAVKDWLGPDNDPVRNQWHWRDLAGMAAFHGNSGDVAPFFIEAEAASVPGGWPRSGAAAAQLPNRHLEYALTWFGLAVTLMVMFGVFAFGKLRGK
jgi:surfeit locus 1 family protein